MLRLVILTLSILFLAAPVKYVSADENFINRPDVQKFMQTMIQKYQFKKEELIYLFSTVKLRPQVIRHMNKPLEREPWKTYQMLFVNEWRIKHGVRFWDRYRTTLARAEQEFGVPASIIVATIGIETKYGQKTGDYRVIDSLSNLAFSQSPRAPYFLKELQEFLLLVRDEHLDPLKMMGSYAGAIGQPQFMPSSYRHYAINFSQSGKTDLMNDEIDVIGSIANYYHKNGWQTNEPVAIQALTLGDRYRYLMQKNVMNKQLSITELSQFGIVPKYKITVDRLKVKVIELQSYYNKEYWLGFHNFYVIKRYNASDLYAMAVYQLSTYIAALKERERQ